MRRICTICARGGSKGLPGKNLRELAGKPLIAHSIIQAKEAELFDAIAISSDSDTILDEGKRWGADKFIKRPKEMADDAASKLPAIKHCVMQVEEEMGAMFDTITDIDVTSPLRNKSDIVGAVTFMEESRVTNVITGTPARKNPYFNMVQRSLDGHVDLCIPSTDGRLIRRQDCPPVFEMNAAVYVWQREAFFNNPDVFYPDTLLYEMPEERSHDIDTLLDFQFVDLLLLEQNK